LRRRALQSATDELLIMFLIISWILAGAVIGSVGVAGIASAISTGRPGYEGPSIESVAFMLVVTMVPGAVEAAFSLEWLGGNTPTTSVGATNSLYSHCSRSASLWATQCSSPEAWRAYDQLGALDASLMS
jgi:hypothetical protein